MKRLIGFALALASVTLAVPTLAQQVPPRATAFATAPDIPFESVPNFLTMPPNLYLGEGIGVARNSKGHVFVFTRSGDTRLFQFDQNGKFVREIGQGLYGFEMAHGVRVDSHVYGGYSILPNYDSMVGKLIVHRLTRDEAIQAMRRALGEFVIEGVKTTIPLHSRIMTNVHFLRGQVNTTFVEDYFLRQR